MKSGKDTPKKLQVEPVPCRVIYLQPSSSRSDVEYRHPVISFRADCTVLNRSALIQLLSPFGGLVVSAVKVYAAT